MRTRTTQAMVSQGGAQIARARRRARTVISALLLIATPALAVLGDAKPVLAQSASAGPSPAAVKQAKTFFAKGSDNFKLNRFAPALEAFKQSYAAVPSPNSHLYIARCIVKLGQPRAGYLEFDKVIAEAQAKPEQYGATGDTAKLERDELSSKLGFVTVNVPAPNDGASVSVGGEDLPRDAWGKPAPVNPGSVDVVLTPAGAQPTKQTLTVAAGETKDVSLAAAPPPTAPVATTAVEPDASSASAPNKTLRTAAYVAAGVGVVGLGIFTVSGIMANSAYSSLKDSCGTSGCPSSKLSEVDSGKTKQTVANVGLVIGGVGIGAGVVLYILSRKGKAKTETTADHLVLGPTYTGWRGTF